MASAKPVADNDEFILCITKIDFFFSGLLSADKKTLKVQTKLDKPGLDFL